MSQDLVQLALEIFEDGSYQNTFTYGDGRYQMRLHEFEMLQSMFAQMHPHLPLLRGSPV